MDELDEIRARKLEELQKQQQLEEQFAQMEAIAKQKLTKEALDRYGNIKAAYPEMIPSIVSILLKVEQERIDDYQFKKLLGLIKPKKREIRIVRK